MSKNSTITVEFFISGVLPNTAVRNESGLLPVSASTRRKRSDKYRYQKFSLEQRASQNSGLI
jgi:hypothetical protein